MRACKSALAALDALSRIPCRNQSSNVSLLTECDVLRNRSIDDIFLHEFGYRHIFAFEGVDALDEIIIVAIACGRVQRSAAVEISPFRLHIDLDQSGAAHLNCGDVGIDDILTLASIGMSSTVLHELEGLAVRHDLLIELEECGLQDRIGMTAHMALDRQTGSVDDVEVCMLLSKTCEHAVRHLGSNLVCREGCVQKERAAFLQLTDHVELVAVAVQRAGDEVCLIDVVRRMDRGLAETQMRTGNAAGLLGVVLEISLGIQIRVVADDLDIISLSDDFSGSDAYLLDNAFVTSDIDDVSHLEFPLKHDGNTGQDIGHQIFGAQRNSQGQNSNRCNHCRRVDPKEPA